MWVLKYIEINFLSLGSDATISRRFLRRRRRRQRIIRRWRRPCDRCHMCSQPIRFYAYLRHQIRMYFWNVSREPEQSVLHSLPTWSVWRSPGQKGCFRTLFPPKRENVDLLWGIWTHFVGFQSWGSAWPTTAYKVHPQRAWWAVASNKIVINIQLLVERQSWKVTVTSILNWKITFLF